MKVGILAAMEEEVAAYLRHFRVSKKEKGATLTFHLGGAKGVELVIVKSGIGKTNAAMCSQLLISRFNVDAIICTGVAGALNPSLTIGDIVVSRDCAHHDINFYFLGYKRGHIPFMPKRFFPASKKLVSLAKMARVPGQRIMVGRVLTGDVFVQDKTYVKKIKKELGGDCIEMEGASVAHVCVMNKIPFVIIRSISDRADHGSPVDFPAFLKKASEQAFLVVAQILSQLGKVKP